MTDINWQDVQHRLQAPFDAHEVKWREQGSPFKRGNTHSVRVVAYVDARVVQDRLDEVFGIAGWRNEYTTGPSTGVVCGLSVKAGDEWITKWDGAENTDIEGVKGGLSDAFKRAAVLWGIGRYLYRAKAQWVKCEVEEYRGKERVKRLLETPRLEFEDGNAPAQPPTPPRNGKSAPPADEHWAQDKPTAAKFWTRATEERGLNGDDVLAALNVKRLSEFTGSKEQAVLQIDAYIMAQTEQPDPKAPAAG